MSNNVSLHGNVCDQCPVALLIIDMINDFEFPGGEQVFPATLEVSARLNDLKSAARDHGVPVIYVNDNFGQWRSDFRQQVDHCLHDGVRGKPIVELLKPEANDYFVLKPKHSGFYATPLEVLLRNLGARSLILTGIAANSCVLFTANDAFLREYRVLVPEDCVASMSPDETKACLRHIESVLDGDISPSAKVIDRLPELLKRG